MRTRECNRCKKDKPEHETRSVYTKVNNQGRIEETKIYCWDCVFSEDNPSLHKYKSAFKKKAREMEVELSKKEQEKEGRRYKIIEIPPKTKKYE